MRIKPIKNYKGIYKITDEGRVYSIKRIDKQGKEVGGRFLKLHNNGKDYLKVVLSKDGKIERKYIHRLVAKHFIPNSQNKCCINHKDGNPKNNYYFNLEWCSYSENIKHSFKKLNRKATYKGKFGKEHNRSRVYSQYDKSGNFIKKWYSSYEIQRGLGIIQQNISKVCKGKRKTAGGFIWKYADIMQDLNTLKDVKSMKNM